MKLIKYIFIGIAAGLANGLFGSGGGTIVVPALTIILCMNEHKAHATAIAVILPLTLVSSFFYIKGSFVDIPLTVKAALGGIIGGYIGARLLKSIPARTLKLVFGGFMILAAIRMVMQIIPFIIGLASGIISGMGIGGGAILIPALVIFLGTEQHTAQAVNLLFFIPTAAAALFIHIKNKSIDVRSALFIAACGIVGAVLGASLAAWMTASLLKRVFGVFLFVMGVYEILDSRNKKEKKCRKDI